MSVHATEQISRVSVSPTSSQCTLSPWRLINLPVESYAEGYNGNDITHKFYNNNVITPSKQIVPTLVDEDKTYIIYIVE